MKTPLYRFLYSDRILTKVLDKRRVGWLDGGCLILAQALTIWLDAELVLIRSDGHTGFDHACAAVRSPASRNELLYIDADGISSERALLDRWTRLEGLSNPRIYRASKLCFQDRDLSLWLVAQLRARFGQPGTAISSLLGSAHERGGRMPHPRLLSVHSVTDILNLIEDFLVNHFGIDDQQEMHGPAFEMLKHVSVLVELRGNNSLAKLRSGMECRRPQ